MQALLQWSCPAALAERKAGGTQSGKRPAHIAVEWIINEKPRRYALTVVTLFSSKDGMDSINMFMSMKADKNSLKAFPWYARAGWPLAACQQSGCVTITLAMSRSSMNAHYFPSIREYQQYIEENFKIIISEWRSIAAY